ncbi:MAG: DUF5680 domain-containing protein [Candidatus Curtissbacteria bacterium]|nr:DUF5680 domain-containing protein [Candidatus Curtissbacteria bacterium]
MKQKLLEVLRTIAKEGYASGKEDQWIKGTDGSTTILWGKLEDEWSMKDVFYGGEPYGGVEVVFHQGKPFWTMVYYGYVVPEITDLGQIYSFLQKALSNRPEEMPLRGPQNYSQGDLTYSNGWEGDIDSYKGKEEITLNGKKVYEAQYLGGYVDQRSEE